MADDFERWAPLRDLALSQIARHGDFLPSIACATRPP